MNVQKNITNFIPPNYSKWQTVELSYLFAMKAVNEGIQGDVVECGTAQGNNLAAMAKSGKRAVGFDSFQGIPWAGEKDDQQPGMEKKTGNTGLFTSGISAHSLDSVHQSMKHWGVTDYELIEGWFQNTIPKQTSTKQIAVLRLDGDLYESTLIPLRYLYPLLSVGGYLIVDDYTLKGCRLACDEYFGDNYPELVHTFDGIPYFRKIV